MHSGGLGTRRTVCPLSQGGLTFGFSSRSHVAGSASEIRDPGRNPALGCGNWDPVCLQKGVPGRRDAERNVCSCGV